MQSVLLYLNIKFGTLVHILIKVEDKVWLLNKKLIFGIHTHVY